MKRTTGEHFSGSSVTLASRLLAGRRLCVTSTLLGLACVAPAWGQATPSNVPQGSPIPRILPPAPPQLGAGVPNFQSQGQEGPLPKASIPVRSVTVIGATAFPAAKLSGLTAGLANSQVPLSRLDDVRRSLVSLYRGQGYVLSTVSLDISAQGDVRYIVTEGYITAVKLSHDIGPAGTMVLKFLQHLTQERPIREATLERWLLLAQQVPGVSVQAVLQAEGDDPGALTLVADVAKQNVSALVTADDRGFKETGPSEVLSVVDLNSQTSLGDQTELSLFHTSGGTDNFGQAAESFFVGSSGLRVRLYGGAGRAIPGGTLRSTLYRSEIQVFGGQLSYPLLLRRNQTLNLTLHFDGSTNAIYTAHFRTSYDSLRAGRVEAQYAWQDLWAGDERSGVNVVDLNFSHGIPYFGASRDGRTTGAGRLGERIDFWKIAGAIQRTQTLFSPFPGGQVALRLAAGGQYTSEIVPSEEEFYLGGSQFTRGFYSGQAAGDKGAYATAELQLNTGYSFNVLQKPVDLGLQFYAFYDWGETWPNLSSDLRHKVETAGGGVRIGVTRFVELDGEALERLTTRLDPASTTTAPLSETVLYWGATIRY